MSEPRPVDVLRSEISCLPLQAGDVEEAASLIGRVFVDHEPTTRALGLDDEVFLPFARAYCLRAAEDGTGVVARDPAEGHLLGALACLDLLEDVRERFPDLRGARYAAKLPDLAFVGALEGPYAEERGLARGQCALISQVAVAEGARGRGLATSLIEAACRAAAARGYERIAAVCTGAASRRAHERAGFGVERTLRLGDWEYEGRRPFAALEGECALLVRRL